MARIAYLTRGMWLDLRPRPNSMAAGIRYTKAGMVCIRSSTGRTIVSTVLLLAVQMPSGIPSNKLIKVADSVKPSVITISSQKPVA